MLVVASALSLLRLMLQLLQPQPHLKHTNKPLTCTHTHTQMPIAAWNELDDDDAPFVPTNLDHLPIDADEDLDYEYITDYV